MIERYTLPEMKRIWSEEAKLATWLMVELAVVDALAEEGEVPREAAARIRRRAAFDAARVAEIEQATRHDVLAFVECVGESIGEDSRYFHAGLTSSDILDTSLALLLKDAVRLVLDELAGLAEATKQLAREHASTLTVGRTHGMHAEPTSLGLKFAVWYNEIGRDISRVKRAADAVCVGKVSGAVGNYSHLSPRIEDLALASLGLTPERPATQIVQRDRHAELIGALAIAAGTMERMGVEVRNLQRTEIAEMEEPFLPGQKGSSSMPHKRNPVALERICGLARLVRGYAAAALENIALWHERDISHSSVERVIIPDATTVVHYMAANLARILGGLRIDVARMKDNVEMTRGSVYSQRLMLALTRAGWPRKKAYEKVQALSDLALRDRTHLKQAVSSDAEVAAALGAKTLDTIFDPGFYARFTEQVLRQTGII